MEPLTESDREYQRKLAADLFNYVWELIEKPDRTKEENDAMIHASHASRYLWSRVGEPVNLARGEWQVSRVYSTISRSEPAFYHASRCLEICNGNGIEDFDLAFAYEAIARSLAVAGKWDESQQFLNLANQAGEQIVEQEDKEFFFRDLATVPQKGNMGGLST